jgi:hypothetical protein
VEPTRLQKTGRPRNSWQRSSFTEAGRRSWRELITIARDRRKWKELVDSYVPDGTTDFVIIIIMVNKSRS